MRWIPIGSSLSSRQWLPNGRKTRLDKQYMSIDHFVLQKQTSVYEAVGTQLDTVAVICHGEPRPAKC